MFCLFIVQQFYSFHKVYNNCLKETQFASSKDLLFI